MTNQLTGGGSVTGRWNCAVGKSAALSMAYGGPSRLLHDATQLHSYMLNYERIEARIRRNSELLNQSMGGKRHKMKRPHDRNSNARLRHAQATLLGWQFTPQDVGQRIVKNDAGKIVAEYLKRWWAEHDGRAPGRLGPYTSRHRAVIAALKDMGLEA